MKTKETLKASVPSHIYSPVSSLCPLESRVQGQKITKKSIHFSAVAGSKEAGREQE